VRKKEAGHVEKSISFHLSRFGASLSSELTNRDGLIDPGVSNSPVVSTRTRKEAKKEGQEGSLAKRRRRTKENDSRVSVHDQLRRSKSIAIETSRDDLSIEIRPIED